jgi:hypothetical protein
MQPHHRGGGGDREIQTEERNKREKEKRDKRKLEVIKREKINIVSATGN